MLLGAVLLQLGFMACSASNATGVMAGLFDGGAQGGDTGVMGGRDARAQEMPCTQWEMKFVPGPRETNTVVPFETGWEPFSSLGLGNSVGVRRCRSTTP
jgi:hypothetical protein